MNKIYVRWCPVCCEVRQRANFCPRCGRPTQDMGRVRGVFEMMFHWFLRVLRIPRREKR